KIGTWTITATYTTFMAQATVVVYGKLYSFGIGAIGNQVVGIAFPITIFALTEQGDSAYTPASLTDTSGTIRPTSILVNGTYTGYVTISIEGTTSITVSSGTISATSNPFFVENVFLPKGLDDIRVWPNPYRSDKSSDPFIVFELPDGCRLCIYTISGRLIKEFEKTLGKTKWMLDNQDGEPVTSGMYIYLIEQNGKKVTGEIGVIR
ncbi:MAG: T9SS type A sorting domain-containing protein, partial [Candidatus Desantisbacteria bacterium]